MILNTICVTEIYLIVTLVSVILVNIRHTARSKHGTCEGP